MPTFGLYFRLHYSGYLSTANTFAFKQRWMMLGAIHDPLNWVYYDLGDGLKTQLYCAQNQGNKLYATGNFRQRTHPF